MAHQRIFLTVALLTATLALPSLAAAQCNSPSSLGLFYMEMERPFQVNTTGAFVPGPAVTMLGAFTPSTDPACLGAHEAVLKVTIPNGCTEARVLIEYDGMPKGWTINLGDSPENNGFGGDSGGPESEAELQILDETLSVYSSALAPGIIDLLAQEDLGLTDGALEIVVRNQYVSWGQPFSFLDTTNAALLFALPDAGAATAEQNTFYLGVNRVVSGPSSRTGCGVNRVLVSFR